MCSVLEPLASAEVKEAAQEDSSFPIELLSWAQQSSSLRPSWWWDRRLRQAMFVCYCHLIWQQLSVFCSNMLDLYLITAREESFEE